MSALAKRCNCPFDTPTDRDKVKDEDGWLVTYCGECRGFVSSVKVSGGAPGPLLPLLPSN